jgi:hypothetical protein
MIKCKPILLFMLLNLEVLEHPGFLQAGQVHDDFENRAVTFALPVHRPELGEDCGYEDADDGAGVSVGAVEESREGAGTLHGSVFWSGIAVGVEERGG